MPSAVVRLLCSEVAPVSDRAIPSTHFFIAQAALNLHCSDWWRGFYRALSDERLRKYLEDGQTIAELRAEYRKLTEAWQ